MKNYKITIEDGTDIAELFANEQYVIALDWGEPVIGTYDEIWKICNEIYSDEYKTVSNECIRNLIRNRHLEIESESGENERNWENWLTRERFVDAIMSEQTNDIEIEEIVELILHGAQYIENIKNAQKK